MADSVLAPDTRLAHVNAAADVLRTTLPDIPHIGLLTGAGTASLADALSETTTVPFADVPHLPTAESGPDRAFVAGMLHGHSVLAVPEPLHLYDGLSAREVALPVRIMGALGIDLLIAAPTAGSVNPHYAPGDVMLLSDHINLQGANPLEGPNVDAWGPRFPDMSAPYNADLRTAAHEAATRAETRLHDGIYLGVPGPNLQTKAEYRFMQHIGADAVGTGLIPEIIAARHMGLRVLGAAVITDACFADTMQPTAPSDVATAAETGRKCLARVLAQLLPTL
ncbi:purine-nucleoside phosphorylase [Longimonas halophila]|nr:purine-nucleoside phosphorylase [Longimonas halophila]